MSDLEDVSLSNRVVCQAGHTLCTSESRTLPRVKNEPPAESARAFRLSTCALISFWKTGHIDIRRPSKKVSSSGHLRSSTSSNAASLKRIMVSSGTAGGAGSIADLTKLWVYYISAR